jgi:large subunit ribosomal protein L24
MPHVKKGDTVLVLAGRDRGKRGTVERVERTKRGLGVVVPGVNIVKKHRRPRSATEQAGILEIPAALDISNVQVVCPHCDKPTRVAHHVMETGDRVRRVRVCRKCGEQLEVGA